MAERRFQRLKTAVEKLTPEQCVELEHLVRKVSGAHVAETAIARHTHEMAAARKCPRCGGAAVKNGFDGQHRQRFKCLAGGCGKVFNALTGTPFARMRKPEKWARYARMMANFKSIDDIADSGLGISRLTAWRWPHRFLKLPTQNQSAQLRGIVEVDETFFRSSYKGTRAWKKGNPPENRRPRYRGEAKGAGLSDEQIPVLAALDRGGGIVEGVLPERTDAAAEAALLGKISRQSVICSDGFSAYPKLAAKSASEHRRIGAPKKTWLAKVQGGKPRKHGRLGLGRVNAHHERTKSFVNRQARGVSTKYLPAYLGWQRAIRTPSFDPTELIEKALES